MSIPDHTPGLRIDSFVAKPRTAICNPLPQVLREEKARLVAKDEALAAKFKQLQEEMIRLQVTLLTDLSKPILTTTIRPSSM